MRDYRAKNPESLEYQAARRKRKVARLREIIDAAKAVPCMDCGRSYPTHAMDFDHVRGEKSFDVSRAVRTMKGVAVTLAEIEKCEVVCATCHRLRHPPVRQENT